MLILLSVLLFATVVCPQESSSVSITNLPTCPHFSRYCEVQLNGLGVSSATLDEPASFDLFIARKPLPSDLAFKIPVRANDTVLQARLIGTTIVAATVTEIDVDHYKVSYLIRDAGSYALQIRLVWLTGASMSFDGFMNALEFSIKSIYIDCTIYNATVTVSGNQNTSLYSADKALCVSGDEPGRWVRVQNHSCPPWACSAHGTETELIITYHNLLICANI
jgi:hypothetical protein